MSVKANGYDLYMNLYTTRNYINSSKKVWYFLRGRPLLCHFIISIETPVVSYSDDAIL